MDALAAMSTTASETPPRSEATWRFEPIFPLSVGFGPVRSPPFLRARRVQEARSQSIRSASLKRSSKTRYSACHTHASYLPRRHLQQVDPLYRNPSPKRQERFEDLPKFVAHQFSSHAGPWSTIVTIGNQRPVARFAPFLGAADNVASEYEPHEFYGLFETEIFSEVGIQEELVFSAGPVLPTIEESTTNGLP